jgi:enolase
MKKLFEECLKITAIYPREILDSRGNPTIEVEVHTRHGCGIASVPSGASTGVHEAFELRDGDKARYNGKGVQTAVKNIRTIIAPKLIGKNVTQQRNIDKLMIDLDATENKSKLGANAILGVSLAAAKAAANTAGISLYNYLGGEEARVLPVPLMNVINGGLHAGNKLSIQEFLILPLGAATFSDALRIGVEVYHALKTVLREQYGPSAINLGDEGGFAPPMKRTDEALDALLKAINKAGYAPGEDVYLALDAAANGFYNAKKETYAIDNKVYTTDALINYYKELVESYPLVSIEDPFHEDAFQGHAAITQEIGDNVQIVGDDLFVTNAERLRWGIEKGTANAVLLKVNQIGTLTEAFDTARLAQNNGYGVIVSHRSGETTDTYIADIAVALNAGQIKTGAAARGERIAKYNRLLNIEAQLGSIATYAGKKILRP